MDLDAKTTVTWTFEASLVGADGKVWDIGVLDNSFRCWKNITHWNLHYRHWDALRGNARDLFTKVIWRKLWRRS